LFPCWEKNKSKNKTGFVGLIAWPMVSLSQILSMSGWNSVIPFVVFLYTVEGLNTSLERNWFCQGRQTVGPGLHSFKLRATN
jgi:hypothetical protein